MVDGVVEGGKKISPEGKAAAAAAYGPIRCLDVVKWLVRKCERDNDRLCMTPLGAPHISAVLCEPPSTQRRQESSH